jgi:hypothetical protein
MAVMRGDNIIVGSKRTTSKSNPATVDDLAERTGLSRPASDTPRPVRTYSPDVCGAMSQQRSDSGSQSTPQKFVRLVGCHDPKIKAPAKR